MEQLSFNFEKLDQNDFVRIMDESCTLCGLKFWIEKVKIVEGERLYRILSNWYRKDQLRKEEIG